MDEYQQADRARVAAMEPGQTWQVRVLAWSYANPDFRMLVQAMLGASYGWNPARHPHMRGPVKIDKAGFAFIVYVGRPGWGQRLKLGTSLEYRDLFRRCADDLHLNDQDHLALFAEVNKFVGEDARAESGVE